MFSVTVSVCLWLTGGGFKQDCSLPDCYQKHVQYGATLCTLVSHQAAVNLIVRQHRFISFIKMPEISFSHTHTMFIIILTSQYYYKNKKDLKLDFLRIRDGSQNSYCVREFVPREEPLVTVTSATKRIALLIYHTHH